MTNRVFLSACVCLLLFVGLGLAQEDRAVVTGTVIDPSQAAISGATVEINSKATGFRREIKTNDSGAYLIPGLLIGVYEVTIRKDGFRTAQYPAFELAVGQIRTINAQMQIASSAQEVQVVAETRALDESSSKVAGVIGATQVSELPINGRAWTALMALVPGAMDSGGGTQKSIRFAGRGGDDNNYRFDGVDASGISAQAPNTSTRLQISTEAIAEFKVDTMLYGADTGGTNGGQVEVISKSGSNAFHGGAFEFIRNDALNTRGPFDGSTLPPLRLNQYGSSLGGRIVKNRTFFFIAYEGLRQRLGTTLIGNVPSDGFRATVLSQSPVLAPIINAFPHGNRNLSSTTSQLVSVGSVGANEDSGLIRIDHRISDSTNFFARYNIDQVQLSSPSGNLLDKSQTSTSPKNAALNLAHVFSPSMFNVLQLGMNRIWALSHTDSHFFDVTKIFNSVSVPQFDKLNQVRDNVSAPSTYTMKDDFTWTRGLHTLKAGVEIRRVLYNYSQASENALVYASLASFAANQLDQVNLIGGVPTHGLDETQFFGYVQDAWKMRPNLTVDVGLRYEFFNAFHEVHGRDLPFDLATCGGFCPVGSAFDFPVKTNFEPRLAVAWSPKALQGKTVIRAGSGFYKGQGQLGDLNAPSDNYTQRLSLSSVSFPGLSFPADAFYAAAANQAVTPRALARNRQDPTVIQWGLQVQTALPAGFILDTGYIGYHGYHQFTRWYINGTDPLTGLRPLPAFGPIDVKQTDSNNHFDGWQTSLRRQFQSGLSFSANYMWSHAINDDSTGGGETDYPQINTCRTCDIASSDADIRHTLSMNMIYRLPFGKGRAYMNRSGIADAALSGWEFSATAAARTGTPVNVTLTRTAAAVPDGLSLENGSSFQRPNYVGGVSLAPANQSINNWINAAAFTAPADGTWGNSGRNLVRGPSFWQSDIALSRDFRITERFVAVFRAEGFNIFNRAQFGNPNGNFSSASFGRVTTTVNGSSATGSGTPREFQFAMRLRF
jgi:hypothetical protein